MILVCSSKIGAPTPVGKVRPVLTVVPGASDADDPRRRSGAASLIDELVREGARRMLAEALQAEVDDYIARFAAERDEHGRRTRISISLVVSDRVRSTIQPTSLENIW